MPREWRCQTFEGVVGVGSTREEAKATFDRDWHQRAPYHLIEGHPPRQKRSDEKTAAAAAVGGETDAARYHRLAVRKFHPDLHNDKRKWTATEIVAGLNEAWEQARPKV